MAFVFLVALGIDYNIFLMARVREEALRHGTRQGMLRGLAVTGGGDHLRGHRARRHVRVLGTLPLVFLTELGFVIAFGVLLDTLLVRSVLVPALVFDIGPRVWWPSTLALAMESNHALFFVQVGVLFSIVCASVEGHHTFGPMSKTSAGTSTERTMKVSSRTPKAITKPSSVRNTSGSDAEDAEGAGQHDARGGDHAAGDRQAAQHPVAGAVAHRLLAHARHQEDVVVDPERDQEHERPQRQRRVGPGKSKTYSKKNEPTPSAARNDSTTVPIRSSGSTIARSRTASTMNTTTARAA